MGLLKGDTRSLDNGSYDYSLKYALVIGHSGLEPRLGFCAACWSPPSTWDSLDPDSRESAGSCGHMARSDSCQMSCIGTILFSVLHTRSIIEACCMLFSEGGISSKVIAIACGSLGRLQVHSSYHP